MMISVPTTLPPTAVLVGLLLAGVCSCSGGEDESAPQERVPAVELPERIEVAAPETPFVDLTLVEDWSEAVANRFVDLADKLRRRDFDNSLDWFAADFAGHALFGLVGDAAVELPLGARSQSFRANTAAIVDARGFVDSISSWISPWQNVDGCSWKVKGADFESGTPVWGRIKFRITLLGTGSDGGPRSVVAWGHARVERDRGNWMLTAFQLDSLDSMERPAPLFTDVATSTGLAFSGSPRFGRPGNRSFAWNGAAAGDVDGDGLTDLYVPSRPSNFLYMARGESGWVDEAESRGVAGPAGGTGAVFFDADNDGDQDLAVGDVGWVEKDGTPGGNPLRFYRQVDSDTPGRFEEVGGQVGLGARLNAYSLVVFDADLDGFSDVFVCNYGRVESEPNDSWTDAKNGSPNALYRSVGGTRYEEVAARSGLVDTRWTYAAAAADIDEDGDLDLYVANDYGENMHFENRTERGGELRFVDIAEAYGVRDLGNGMGISMGDLTGDGKLDLYVSNMSSTAGNRILGRLGSRKEEWQKLKKLAAGNTIFVADAAKFATLPSDAGGIGGSWAWSSALFDLDLDGRLDVYCCSGFVTGDTAADT